MCDDQSLADEAIWLKAQGQVSRRKFAGMVGASGLFAMLPTPAFALDIAGRDVVVTTPDGLADCYFAAPAKGKHPGVIIWPDIFGLRPAFRQMADRLARSGYSVLVVNPYYRAVKSPVLPEGVDPRAPENWAKVREQAGKLTPQTNVSDALAFVAFLDNWHDRLLHGRANGDADSSGGAQPDRGRSIFPWEQPCHRQARQRSLAHPPNKGRLPDRDC
jgi:carboxymethylenebutenolidase